MKVPKYTSQTKSSASVNNPLSIQANPSGLSQGYKAQSQFGSTVANFGNTVVNLGIKVQEIKNATESQTIKNEIHRVTEDLKLRAISLPEGIDAEDWMNQELLKVQDAFSNGGTYTPPDVGVDGGFESKTYGLGGKADWNSAVKKVMNTEFANNKNLSSVAMKKINATRYYNEMKAQRDDYASHLIDSIVFNDGTPEGEIAWQELFGSEETVLEDGTIQPGVVGLLEKNLQDGLYKDGIQGYLNNLREVEAKIANGIASSLMQQADLSVDSDDIEVVDNSRASLLDFSESLGEFIMVDDGRGNKFRRFELFPEISIAERQSIQKDLLEKRKSIRDDYFSRDKTIFNYNERERARNNLKHTNILLEEMTNNPTMFHPSSIDNHVKKNLISFERGKALHKIWNDRKSGKNIQADVTSKAVFNMELSDAYDEYDLDQLEAQATNDLLYEFIGEEDYKERISAINTLRNGNDLEFNRTAKYFRNKLKNRIGVIDGIVKLGDEQKEILNNTISRFEQMLAVDPVTKKGLTYKEMQSSYNLLIQDFFTNNTKAIDEIVSNNQAPMPNPELLKQLVNSEYLVIEDDLTNSLGLLIAKDHNAFRENMETAINRIYPKGSVEHKNETEKVNQLINMFRYYAFTPKDLGG